MPTNLTSCQQAVAQAFIDGPLLAHENAHKAAFSQYNGEAELAFNFTVREDQVERALTNVMNKEDVRRANKTRQDSGKLDSWKKNAPDFDCTG